jgi:anti-sigma B factor antagonist
VIDSAGFGEPLLGSELAGTETFATRVSGRDGMLWIAMGGELDVFTAPRLRSTLDEAITSDSEPLVLDLRGLEFLDSSGLAVILGVHERREQAEAEPLRIVIRGSDAVEALFDTIGAADYLHLVDDPAELTGAGRG